MISCSTQPRRAASRQGRARRSRVKYQLCGGAEHVSIVKGYSRSRSKFFRLLASCERSMLYGPGRWCSAGEWEGIMKTRYTVALSVIAGARSRWRSYSGPPRTGQAESLQCRRDRSDRCFSPTRLRASRPPGDPKLSRSLIAHLERTGCFHRGRSASEECGHCRVGQPG